MTPEEIKEMWVKEVYDQGKVVDPENRYCWESLAVGWLLGKGYSVSQAEFLVRQFPL